MSTSAAQILGWLLAASAGTRIVDDLIEHGHGLAAVCQPALVNRDTAAAIVTQVEQGTGDDGMLVAGAALSSAMPPFMLGMLDLATRLDSPLRSGYAYVGWPPFSANDADIKSRFRALADPRAIAAQGRLGSVWDWNTGSDTPEWQATSDVLGFVYGYKDCLPQSKWPQYACDLAARDILDPGVALMIALRGVQGAIDRETIISSGFADELAAAFERQQARTRPLSLPPVIV
jgi:hypothetical protein